MEFHPVILFPQAPAVIDFSKGWVGENDIPVFAIGKYDEKRPAMYSNEALYQNERNIHVGIDLFAPLGTPIYAVANGKISQFKYHAAELDYGNTLITEHEMLGGLTLYILHGHLSQQSLANKKVGDPILKGDVIAWIGDRHENGGWYPHLHFQISYDRPLHADMPGVVSAKDRESALLKYPDPRLVLGNLY